MSGYRRAAVNDDDDNVVQMAGDPGELPMAALQVPPSRQRPQQQQQHSSAAYLTPAEEYALTSDGASELSVANPNPPAHHLRHHDKEPANTNAEQYLHTHSGADADDEGAEEDDPDRTRMATGSSQWPTEQHATLVDREKAPGKLGHAYQPSNVMSLGSVSSGDETDDFDWDTSTDEEDEDGDGATEKVVNPDGTVTVKRAIRARRGRALYLGCMRLARPVRIVLFGLVGTAIAMVPFIVAISAFNTSPARAQLQVWSVWLAIIWAAACGTWLFVDWIPALLMKLAIAVYGRAPEIFKFWIEVIMAVGFFVKLLGAISWAWISLSGVLAIQFAYADRPKYFVWIFRVLQALFATSMILLVEKVLLQLVAINFHKTALSDRLEQNQKALRVLDKLYESKYEVPRSRNGWTSGHWGRGWGAAGGSRPGSRPPSPGPNNLGSAPMVDQNSQQPQHQHHHHHHHPHLHRHHRGQPSEHDAAKAARRANFASQLADALQMATMKNSKLYKGRTGSAQSARRLAKKLFNNLSHSRKYLIADDFAPYFKDEAEAKEAFAVFDADKNGDISKTEMREAVQRIYKERRALSSSLKDVSSAVAKLDGVLLFVGLIIVIFIWLLIFSPEQTVTNLVPLSTVVVSFSFVFGNTLKNIFESMIFLFATHPYDSGDLVCVDDVWMFVKDFGLISTTFRTTTNEEIVAPNALLATSKYIHNARRSASMWETTKIQTGFETALATIDEFRKRMRAYVKENDREWGGGLDVNLDSVDDMNCINLVVAMEHKGNWQDWGARWARRTKLMRHIKTVCEDLGMEYSLPAQPVTFAPRSGPAPFSNLQQNARTPRNGSGVHLEPNAARGGMTLRV